MKKRTEDLIHEIMESKNISTYIDTNQDEFLDTTLYQHLQNLLAEKIGRASCRERVSA